MTRAARIAVPATLAVALASGVFLAWYDEEPQAGAPLHLSPTEPRLVQEPSMSAMLIVGLLAGRLHQRFAECFSGRRRDSLSELDARTLADIGVDPSEIASIEAESLGRSPLTRRRIVAAIGRA